MGYERTDRRYHTARDYDRDAGDRYRRYDEDRGFFDRAGDEVRSWFGDEEAERRRRLDEIYDERYNRDRYEGGRYARYQPGGYSSPDGYPRWTRSNQSGDARRRYASGYSPYSTYYPGPGEDRQFGTDYGTHRTYGDAGYDDDDSWRTAEYRALYGRRGHPEDQHGYHGWRSRQLSEFDRDYDEYRRENQSRFESEFSAWRQNRQTQREALRKAKEHQEVVGSDGEHVGTIDHVRGDRILLTRTDRDAGGHHHSIPSSWIQMVDDKVHLSRTAEQTQQAWRDEEDRRGLFGRDDDGDGRSGVDLNRSFSGTY
ncbi:DUF2171 domain-containing protein [Sphingomonas oligoaromativorans]|uniref:DUF2171 domain-containing protein n=1 Tax=Sphingomonas oligoaromativorans TaxID=575322 RepID=UPI0014249896|nr:DUF2171 domain-containing protein [Sphingomonas oligoaromativorans]NIJ33305.1 hypothetical protein [Sphingomonas oligoaromativorans]